MSCTNPSRMFDTGYLTDNGKPLYKYCSKNISFIHKPISKELVYSNDPRHFYSDIFITDYIEVPCQKCEACRLAKSKEWMERCMLEQKEWKYNEMITLTYSDEHLPKNQGIDMQTGEVLDVETLRYEDFQEFKKRLLRYWDYHYKEKDIRFYMCGEYGDKRGRPHYHAIFFNLNIRDKEFHKYSDEGFPLFTSKIIEKLWGKGWVQINEVNEKTCAYVARYILKKQKGKGSKQYYEAMGKVPEFTKCSNRPGIANNYYQKHKDDIYEYDKLVLKTNSGAQQIKPSSYYDRLFDADEHEKMEEIKERRKDLAEKRQATINRVSGLTIDQQREFKANALHERLKKFKRNYEEKG